LDHHPIVNLKSKKMKLFLLSWISTFALLGSPINQLGIEPTQPDQMIMRTDHLEANTISLQLANLEKRRTKVSLIDLSGHTWYKEHVWGSNGYFKSIDLNATPDGTYLLIAQNKRAVQYQGLYKIGGTVKLFQLDDVS